MRPRFFIFCAAVTFVLANGAFAGGAYQPTEDRKKALVWNNDPKPEDAASWSGDRDADGYATGPGTLKWYRVGRAFTTGSNLATGRKKTEISNYSGTMVHGKFTGHVVTVDHGKTYYATFADGRRKGNWTAGPLIVKAEGLEAASEKPETRESARSTEAQSSTEKISQEKPATRIEEEPAAPAAGPAETEAEVSGQKPAVPAQGSGERQEISKSAATKPAEPSTNASPTPVQRQSGPDLAPRTNTQPSPPLIAQASTEEPGESATPREPVTRKAALAPGAVRAIERPTSAAPKKSEPARAKPEKTENIAKSAKSTTSQPAELDTNLKEDLPAEGPGPAAAEKPQTPTSKTAKAESSQISQSSSPSSRPSAKETPADDSIRELTGPPSSLRSNPPPETKPPSQIPTPAPVAASPPLPATPKLTAVNAMDIADIEARTKGYDLGEYQLPKAEYNSATDTWSVAYIPRDADSTAKKLNVTIQDKNGKAEVRK